MTLISNSLLNHTTPAAVEDQWIFHGTWKAADGHCEACGHAILYHFCFTKGSVRMIVGSECAAHYGNRDFEQTKTRLTRARRQWTKQTPPAKTDETKADYLARRILEMNNARAAFDEYRRRLNGFEKKGHFKTALRAAKILKLPVGVDPDYQVIVCRCSSPRYVRGYGMVNGCSHLNYSHFQKHLARKIARIFKANPFDFLREIWEVARI